MVEALYLGDSYLRECDSEVVSISRGRYVVLDRTIFYPKGGGQPCDTGKILLGDEEYRVVYVGKFSGRISHEVEGARLEVGDEVRCVLDWDRRYKLMRSHTAAHVYASLVCEGTGALVTGNKLGLDHTRFDFSLDHYDPKIFQKYVDESNKLFKQDIPVRWYTLPREEALKIPGIVKMAEAVPPDIPSLRVVEVVGVDIQADGGTHVRSLREVGKIRLVKTENKGRDNRRVYFSLEG